MTLDQFFTQPTEDPEPATPPAPEPPVEVTADEGSRLAELHAAYPAATAAPDEAADRLKAITDGIKAELTAIGPDGAARLQLQPPAGSDLPPLALTHTVSQRFDSKAFKDAHPDVYATYTRPSGSWRLAPVTGRKARA